MTIAPRAARPGLTAEEVAERLRDGRRNDVPVRPGRSVAAIVRANVLTPVNAIIMVVLVAVVATGSWINTLFGGLIFINSAIGIVQELRAKRTLDHLTLVGEARQRVRRDGQVVDLLRTQIVLDDLVEVGPGDQVVVDGLLVEADNLEVDESLLTGEAEPTDMSVGSEVLSGSFVVAGTGTYRATRVGAEAYAAQLAVEAAKATLAHSELQQGINRILRVIPLVLVPVALATGWIQTNLGTTDWRAIVLRSAGAIIPMIPVGLVLMTSVAFSLGVIRLGRRHCLVQELPALEGLARVDVLCVDKTGTLTESGLAFRELVLLDGPGEPAVRQVLGQLAAADTSPNPSMLAIAEAFPVGQAWPCTARVPFTSARKWSGADFAGQGTWLLGAADVLASGSATAARAETLGARGHRVLLLAGTAQQLDGPVLPAMVRPVALVVLDQRVRPEAAATLDWFAEQQVAMKILSGDNPASVGAVTEALGLGAGSPVDARALPGPGPDLDRAVEETVVFGRVTPHRKRELVAGLQHRGHVVGMVGDGVNDVLALKDCDLGVAMGTAAPATRAVAKVVLLDNNFATLPAVVAEGRRVLANIERVAHLFLTKTIYSAALALLIAVWQLPYPFLPIHVSMTAWFTIGYPAFVLSLAPDDRRARAGFVRRVLAFSVPAGALIGVATFVTYLRVHDPGDSARGDLQAGTAALATLIIGALWVLVVVARPYRWWKIGLVALSIVAYALLFSWPLAQQLLFLDPGDRDRMATGVLVGLMAAAGVEVLWWVLRRLHR